MFSWLSNDSSRSAASQNHPFAEDETPETPAPIFAMRAFKHAIYGTPSVDRENSPSKRSQGRPEPGQQSKTSALVIDQPVNGRSFRRRSEAESNEPKGAALSPKPSGILLTPGLSANRRKTVSFGTEREKSSSTPTSKHAAAKPTHCNAKRQQTGRKDSKVGTIAKQYCSNHSSEHDDLFEISGQADDAISQDRENFKAEEVTLEIREPRTASGRYWKSEFDTLSAESEQRLRQLAKKELLARTFAKHKEDLAMNLEIELEEERKQIAELRKQLQIYTTQSSASIHQIQCSPIDEVNELKDRQVSADNHVKSSPNTLRKARWRTEEENNGRDKVPDIQINLTSARLAELERENRRLRVHLRMVEKQSIQTQTQDQEDRPIRSTNDILNGATVRRRTIEDSELRPQSGVPIPESRVALLCEDATGTATRSNDLRNHLREIEGVNIDTSARAPLCPRESNSLDNILPKLGMKSNRSPITQERRDAARMRLAQKRKGRQVNGETTKDVLSEGVAQVH